MNAYTVKKFRPKDIETDVPASKSLLNRALVLSALSSGTVKLECGSFGEDTRAMLGCLAALGIGTELGKDGITVHGCGGDIPIKNAEIDVMSAGTAARFLSVMLAFCGGTYTLRSSLQMQKRPMEILRILADAGVRFEFFGESGHFPFRMHSDGISADRIVADTDLSTQYASGLLLAASARKTPLTVALTGSRTNGSYIGMTLGMLSEFGIRLTRTSDEITVYPSSAPPRRYEVEGDMSGACYFFALALLFGIKVFVRRVRLNTLQGDIRFLDLLREKGVAITERTDGVLADGTGVTSFDGFRADLRDFSDQTLTVAALAPFATSPSRLENVEHIRFQECDRIRAITENLNTLGVPARSDGANIDIFPAPIKGGTVGTFNDHRVAMSFALIGLKTGNVTIENPDCCKKTFAEFFEILTKITE